MEFVAQHKPDYFIGSLFFIAAWLVVYLALPKSRRAILWASVTLLPVGPLLESLYIIDYWRPEHWVYWQFGWLRVSFEDFIFTFTCAGICAGFFDVVHRKQDRNELEKVTLMSYLRLLLAGGLCVGLIWVIWNFGRHHQIRWLHSVNSHCLACVIVLPVVCVRRTWAVSALSSALGGAVFMIIFYKLYYLQLYPNIFERWWLLQNLSGIRIFGVLIEEIYWMAATVLYIGPVVRFCLDVTPEKKWKAAEQFRGWRKRRKEGKHHRHHHSEKP